LEAYSLSFFIFLFGLCFGSFINVLILRLPLKLSLLTRSACTSCGTLIPWYYNIPLFSYIFLRGKCAFCHQKISFQYFAVELLCASLTLILFYKLGLTQEFLMTTLLFYILVLLSFIDLKYHAVPDYLLLIALILVFFLPNYEIIEQVKAAFMLSGGVVLLVFVLNFYIQNIKSRITNNDELKTQTALGEGDIPIIAIMGAILGVKAALVAIFLASLFAIIPALYNKFIKKQQETPFIPFLVLGLGVEYIFSLSKAFN